MATPRAHSRSSYSVLLFQKLLNLRDGVSPLTLVLDTVRESGTPLIEEMMLRAKTISGKGTDRTERARVVYVSMQLPPHRRSPYVDVYVARRGQSLDALRTAIDAAVASAPRVLLVVDSICQLARQEPLYAAAFVSSLVTPTVSVLGIYHTDGPTLSTIKSTSPLLRGKPHPFRVLCHLATAVLRVSPLHEEVARKRARDRAEEPPQFGWAAGEGWPLPSSEAASRYGSRADLLGKELAGRSLLVGMELRRRSGRAVVEQYVVVFGSTTPKTSETETKASTASSRGLLPWQKGASPCNNVTVMADHPLFAIHDPGDRHDDDDDEDDTPTSTFNLGLTDKQRKDREGIVLPYFDAQTDIGFGEGGRILYDMGREDDFDDEEDEI
ncbi:hypothetical protein SEUCBS139899_000163 [Sporothrix eucalyptigena]|uniref:Elongator complex protein 5 n=1 Tax=Sporothrix eucalyptigena TaxID=1812306 RepID=A0ABP0C8C5_9PEZI